jgi:hypothetical protein
LNDPNISATAELSGVGAEYELWMHDAESSRSEQGRENEEEEEETDDPRSPEAVID